MRGTTRGAALAACLALGGALTGCQAGSATPDPQDSSPTVASSTSAATAPAAAPSCDWEARASALAPVADRDPDLAPAVAMEDWVWDCVDASWDVSVDTAYGGADSSRIDQQVLDLVAPDGTHVLLFALRGDVTVQLVDADVQARLAWTARMGEGDTSQVVEVDLETGEATEDWGDGAIPSNAISGGAVVSVGPYLPLRDGTTLWASFHYLGDVSGLFLYEGDGDFAPIPGAEEVEQLLADGSVTRWADPGVSVWVAPNAQWVAILGQRQVGRDPFGSSELGRWVAIDLGTGAVRESTSPLPEGLCRPAQGAALQGTFEEPGTLPAECWDGAGGDARYTLSLTDPAIAG